MSESKNFMSQENLELYDRLIKEYIGTQFGTLKFAVTTQAEYDALTEIDENTVYFISDATDIVDADNISYDNTESGLEANNMQEAIDEMNDKVDGIKDANEEEY